MREQVRLFLCALQFLTRLPTPDLKPYRADAAARSAVYYPVVGWIVGGVAALVLLAAERFWPPLIGAALSTAAAVLATGGFHEDGLADTADGLIGGQTRERRLEIMKDSRIGAYGSLALWSVLTLRTLALASLPPVKAALALVIVHGAARALPALAMSVLPYAGDPDRSKLGGGRVKSGQAAMALAIGLGAFCLALLTASWTQVLLALGLAALASGGMALAARRLIGGWTGDVLGALEQVAEVALVLGLAASFKT